MGTLNNNSERCRTYNVMIDVWMEKIEKKKLVIYIYS